MSELLFSNLIIVYFLYGLSFFVMGLTITLESAMTSRFRLVPGLWLLAAFGVLHGLSEWVELILDIETKYNPSPALDHLGFARLLLMSVSFACLLQFGVGMYLRRRSSIAAKGLTGLLSVAFWSLALLPFAAIAFVGAADRYLAAEIVTRYGLGFPGGLLAAYALSWQGQYYRDRGQASRARGLFWGAIGFTVYAFVEGAIAPVGDFWPASQFNESSFQGTFGIPVEVARAGVAILIAVFMTKTFVIESRRALETAHQFLASLNESMKAITSSLNLDAVLKLIIQQAAKAVGARGGVLLLAESSDQELLEKARYGDWHPSTLDPSHPTCLYLFSKAKEIGKAILLDSRKNNQDLLPETGMDQLTYLCAPIAMSERTLGAILLARQQGDHPFSEEDMQLVTALAGEAAVAIENARLYEYTWEMTITDALTGLRNYRYLHDRLQDEVTRAARYQHPFSIIAADCDSLKKVNDQYGHYHGDRLLQGLAEIMRRSVRASDVVTRQAGDEFVILLPETTVADAAKTAGRVRRAVEEFLIDVDGDRVGTTMSFGVATFPDHASDAEDLLRKADEAMYKAKATGKNGIAIWDAV